MFWYYNNYRWEKSKEGFLLVWGRARTWSCTRSIHISSVLKHSSVRFLLVNISYIGWLIKIGPKLTDISCLHKCLHWISVISISISISKIPSFSSVYVLCFKGRMNVKALWDKNIIACSNSDMRLKTLAADWLAEESIKRWIYFGKPGS